MQQPPELGLAAQPVEVRIASQALEDGVAAIHGAAQHRERARDVPDVRDRTPAVVERAGVAGHPAIE